MGESDEEEPSEQSAPASPHASGNSLADFAASEKCICGIYDGKKQMIEFGASEGKCKKKALL